MRNLSIILLVVLAAPPAEAELAERIEAAMAAESRPQADKDRDRNRRPVETLAFFGIQEDMKVLELIPGGGWYTRLLGPALAETGELHVALRTDRIKERGLLEESGLEHVKLLEPEVQITRVEGSRHRDITPFEFGEAGFDAVLTFRNQHNFTAAGRKVLNEAVLEALAPGGIYGIVDHSRRHMEPDGSENRRRLDPVLVIQEVTDAGFEFVGFSDLHYRPDDELRYEVGRKTVTGNTDRFTLKFRKPR